MFLKIFSWDKNWLWYTILWIHSYSLSLDMKHRQDLGSKFIKIPLLSLTFVNSIRNNNNNNDNNIKGRIWNRGTKVLAMTFFSNLRARCRKLLKVEKLIYWQARREGRGRGANAQGPGDFRGPVGPRQGPQSTLSTYENIYIGPVTALYERARDRSAQGPGFSLGGPVYWWAVFRDVWRDFIWANV